MNKPNPTHAQVMESQECDAVIQERCDDYLHREAAQAEQAQAGSVAAGEQDFDAIKPQVELNTDQISECHEPTTADEMEAEERELVMGIKMNIVCNVVKSSFLLLTIKSIAVKYSDFID